MNKKGKIAVVGAGISGLACAYELQKMGYDVEVFEKEGQVGGRMATRVKDDFYFDIGADHLCNLFDNVKEYCEELGVEWEQMRFLQYGVFKNGKVIPPYKTVNWWGRFKLALKYRSLPEEYDFFDLSKFTKFDTENAYQHILQTVNKDAADYLADSFTSTYQFHRAAEISMGALMGVMASIKHHRERWYLQRTKNGMSALPEAIADKLNVSLNKSIVSVSGGDKPTVDGQEYDKVVLATPAPISAKILSNGSEGQMDLLGKTEYSSSISVCLRVDTKLVSDTAVTWVPYVESKAISGFINESMKGDQLIHDGKTLISVWLHEDFAKSIMDLSDDDIFAAVKTEFTKVCPWIEKEESLSNHDLQRWPLAMPKFCQGHLSRVVDFLAKDQGANNIFLCGDYLNSPWIEGSLRLGKRVASQLADQQ